MKSIRGISEVIGFVPRRAEPVEDRPDAYLVRWPNGVEALKLPSFYPPGMRARSVERGATVIPLYEGGKGPAAGPLEPVVRPAARRNYWSKLWPFMWGSTMAVHGDE